MASWKRTPKSYLTKTKKLTDGQILGMLSPNLIAPTEFDERVYTSLQDAKSAVAKSLGIVIIALGVAVLAYFKVLKGVSTGGVEIAPAIFRHASLIGISLATTLFCFGYCKLTFLQAWFSYRLKMGSPSQKVNALLLYPDAYWYFAYLPGAIGYPKHVFGRRSDWLQVVYLLLVIIAVAIYTFGFLCLWIALSIEVWQSPEVEHTISIMVVVSSAICLVLGYLAPFYYDIPRQYTHYGLVHLLQRRKGSDLQAAHAKIATAATSMGLLPTSSADQNRS
jgi:hypothetical protein